MQNTKPFSDKHSNIQKNIRFSQEFRMGGVQVGARNGLMTILKQKMHNVFISNLDIYRHHHKETFDFYYFDFKYVLKYVSTVTLLHRGKSLLESWVTTFFPD